MKKLTYILAFVLPAAMMFSIVDANAQRRNTTNHDVKAAIPAYDPEAEQPNIPDAVRDHYRDNKNIRVRDADYDKGGFRDYKHKAKHDGYNYYRDGEGKAKDHFDCGCRKDKKCLGDCMKKNSGRWIEKKTADINEEYDEAVEKVYKTSFNQDQKKLLIKQAKENRDMAIEQLKDRAELRKNHMQERMDAGMGNLMGEKANRKAIKEIMDIK